MADDKRLRVLVSRPYMKKGMLDWLSAHHHHLDILVDSGGFTIAEKRKDEHGYTVENHVAFIEQLPFACRHFQLDLPGNYNVTHDNWRTEIELGRTQPIPIFTRDAPIEILDEMLSEADVVGIAGGAFRGVDADGKMQHKYAHLKWVMENGPVDRMHWLGITSPNLLSACGPASADSVTWHSAEIYGRLKMYLGGNRWTQPLQWGRTITREHRRACLLADYNPAWLRDQKNWIVRKSHGLRESTQAVMAHGWIRFCNDLLRRANTRLYLAVSTKTHLEFLYDCWTRLNNIAGQ